MARITTNTTGTQPSIVISSNVVVNANNTYTTNFSASDDIIVPQVQDLTVTNSTGVYSYTTFSDTDMRKLSTPADNTISTNVVIDDVTWFGDGTPASGNAQSQGLQFISSNKVLVGFRMFWNDSDGTGAGARFRQGVGFVTNLAPTVSPDAPVWVTPLEIAVDSSYTDATL